MCAFQRFFNIFVYSYINNNYSYVRFSYLGSICCFYDTLGDKSHVVLFNNSSLSKCQEILKARRDQNLKYSIVELPEVPDNIHGYHIPCYRRFTALSKSQRDKMQRAIEISNILISTKAVVYFKLILISSYSGV